MLTLALQVYKSLSLILVVRVNKILVHKWFSECILIMRHIIHIIPHMYKSQRPQLEIVRKGSPTVCICSYSSSFLWSPATFEQSLADCLALFIKYWCLPLALCSSSTSSCSSLSPAQPTATWPRPRTSAFWPTEGGQPPLPPLSRRSNHSTGAVALPLSSSIFSLVFVYRSAARPCRGWSQ